MLNDDEALMVFLELLTAAGGSGRVVLPVTVSDRALRLCAARGIEVVPAALSPSGFLEAAAGAGVMFAADRRGGYVFPGLLPAFDAAAALARLVSLLGRGSATVADIAGATPAMPIVHEEVATPFEQKGLIMRTLMEQLTEEGAELVLVDGIKEISAEGWVLVVPDPEDPVTHVWAEGVDRAASDELAATCVDRIHAMLP